MMEEFNLEKKNAENWIHMNKEILLYFFLENDFVMRTMSEIHNHFEIPRPRVTKIVERGVEYGFLRRYPNYFDIRLTSNGKSVVLDIVYPDGVASVSSHLDDYVHRVDFGLGRNRDD